MTTINSKVSPPNAVAQPPLFPRFANAVSFDVATAIGETERALLILFLSGEQHWMPKSQTHADSEVKHRGDEGTYICSKWISEQKSLNPSNQHDNAAALDRTQLNLVEPHRIYREFMRDFHPDVRSAPVDSSEVVARVTALWREVLKALGKR
jgi:hypothetical protein